LLKALYQQDFLEILILGPTSGPTSLFSYDHGGAAHQAGGS
jgi:hypothetical protein